MKKTPREPIYKIDEFEDLTLFANESFDTQDVDLFEFSGEESSPLARLKSIILSLDWEINDEILQELADEVEYLQTSWLDNTVAEIYLQGLGKIGSYIRAKGAYAHPNSIKLLLTFYYNFEKIVSTEEITKEEINQLLASDVRKFRILQYQINQSEGQGGASFDQRTASATPALATVAPAAEDEQDQSKQLRAAILSLDWEVTDESLKQFNLRIAPFHQHFADNRPALVLILGLQALGDYIAEQRAQSHPEAFILLHSFSEALDQVAAAEQQPLAADRIEAILVDRVNRLNSLKMLIASPNAAIDEQKLDQKVSGITGPVGITGGQKQAAAPSPPPPLQAPSSPPTTPLTLERTTTTGTAPSASDLLQAEIDTLFTREAKPAMETADRQYPDEILPPEAITPVVDELTDDFIDAQLGYRGLMPALSDSDEVAGYNDDAEPLDLPAQNDLAEQLDFLFSEASSAEGKDQSPAASRPDGNGDEDAGALADVFPEENRVEAALTGAEPPGAPPELDLEAPESRQNSLEIEDRLDSFFALALEDSQEAQPGEELAGTQDQAGSPAPALAEAFADHLEEVESALAVVEEAEEIGPPGADETETGARDLAIEDKLDLFFADGAEAPVAATAADEHSVEEIEQSLFLDQDKGIQSALADSSEDHGFSEEEAVAALDYIPMEEIEQRLDFFFGAETDHDPLAIAEQDSGPGDGRVEPPPPPTPDLAAAGKEETVAEMANPLDHSFEETMAAIFAPEEEWQEPGSSAEDKTQPLAASRPEAKGEEDAGALANVFPGEDRIEAALTGAEPPGAPPDLDLEDLESRLSSLEIEDRLDSFFALALEDSLEEQPGEELAGVQDQAEVPAPALADAFTDDLEEMESALAGVEEAEEISPPRVDETGALGLAIEDKLDLFFADSAEAPVTATAADEAVADEHSVEEIEQSLFFGEDKGVQSALADSSEDRGFSEEEAVAALDYVPMEEIEQRLDFFFDAETDHEPLAITEEDTRADKERLGPPPPTPDLAATGKEEASGDEAAVAETASPLDHALEGALADIFRAEEELHPPAKPAELAQLLPETVAATGGKAEADSGGAAAEVPDSPADSQILLASLGVLLPGVIRATSPENLAQAEQLLAALANANLSADHQALLQLLKSVIDLMSRLPGCKGAVTEKLVNHLYEQLLATPCPPEALAEAVSRFTAWMHGGLAVMPALPTRTDQNDGTQFAYTAKELYFELTELRLQINKEFAQLRHEMHHRH